jgi:ElaA protein
MKFNSLKFEKLNVKQLYDILQLRSEVFVVEQDCVYQDIDGHDQIALHVLAYDQNILTTYARILPPKTYFEQVSIGRIIVKQTHRGQDLGHQLMKYCINFIAEKYGKQTIKISAQEHLKAFYEQHGFKQIGEAYLEDGIPHVAMMVEITS